MVIVIPAFNAAQTIDACLSSVLAQTYLLRAIIVDDGSTDGTSDLLETRRRTDSRVDVISLNQNSGVSFARNVGIDAALKLSNCEWIVFVDADDMLCEDFIEKLVEDNGKNSKSRMVCSSRIRRVRGTEEHSFCSINADESVILTSECAGLLLGGEMFPVVWAKMIHRSLFDYGVRFNPDLVIGEDFDFLARLFALTEFMISIVPNDGYRWIDHDSNSLTSGVWNNAKILSDFLCLISGFDLLQIFPIFSRHQARWQHFVGRKYLGVVGRFAKSSATAKELKDFEMAVSAQKHFSIVKRFHPICFSDVILKTCYYIFPFVGYRLLYRCFSHK